MEENERLEQERVVMCPISPQLVALLKQPGGLTTAHPVRCWLDENNVLCMQELYPKESGDQ